MEEKIYPFLKQFDSICKTGLLNLMDHIQKS